jgi:hypothetical protein
LKLSAIAEKYAAGDTPESVMKQVAQEIEIYSDNDEERQ